MSNLKSNQNSKLASAVLLYFLNCVLVFEQMEAVLALMLTTLLVYNFIPEKRNHYEESLQKQSV